MTEVIKKDTLREEVERLSGGKQTIIYTAKGYPSYMNVIPKFRLEDLHPALGSGVHPAFVVGGVEKSEIFIGTYQAVLRDGEAVSLPGQDPAVNINFDAARAACLAAGGGFHLMTNWEWAAIALWCFANGIDVRGNTNCGASHSHPNEKGEKSGKDYRTLTGSGPDSWRHDGTPNGIADLVGNVWEWKEGLKLVSGRIIMPPDNDFSLPEAQWPEAGACIDFNDDDCPMIAGEVSNKIYDCGEFRDTTAKEGFEPPSALQQALLLPFDGLQLPGWFWADSNDGFEALPFRGGLWGSDSVAGLAAVHLSYGRSVVDSFFGFRPAFIA